MAKTFYFDFRDVFRAGRSGFKGKKIGMHFLGLMIGYVVYEGLTYLGLVGSGLIREFWARYGMRPVFFHTEGLSAGLPLSATILMGIGVAFWLIVYYIFSTAVSKVAVEELRGDEFFSVTDALKFACSHWKSIFATMIALIGIFAFCLFWPSLVGLLDLIPGIQQAAEHFGTPVLAIFAIPVYFLGLFMVLLIVAFIIGLFLIPPIVAVTGEDTFEAIYQLLSVIWNQPWRLVVYEAIMKFVKVLGTVIFAGVSAVGMYLALLPSMLLAEQGGVHYFANVVARSLRIIGFSGDLATSIIPGSSLGGAMPWTLDVATFFLSVSFIMIAAIVLAYPLSIMSAGYTIVYVILRKKTTDENMLDIEEDEDIDVVMGVEEEAQEEAKSEEPESESNDNE